MARYRLVFRRSVAKDLLTLPKKDVQRILKKFEAISNNPRGSGCEKLTAQERYRIRVGKFRIVYEIHDDAVEVVVVRVGHRREVYREN